jgi:hypothetical protein
VLGKGDPNPSLGALAKGFNIPIDSAKCKKTIQKDINAENDISGYLI